MNVLPEQSVLVQVEMNASRLQNIRLVEALHQILRDRKFTTHPSINAGITCEAKAGVKEVEFVPLMGETTVHEYLQKMEMYSLTSDPLSVIEAMRLRPDLGDSKPVMCVFIHNGVAYTLSFGLVDGKRVTQLDFAMDEHGRPDVFRDIYLVGVRD